MNQEAHGGPVSEAFISIFPQFIQNQMFIDGQFYHPTFLYESMGTDVFWSVTFNNSSECGHVLRIKILKNEG
jgi:prolipoprotein diacylglyceryltransferase